MFTPIRFLSFVVLAFASLFLLDAHQPLVQAHPGCRCSQCGCGSGCQKVCRLVCEEKKVQITCWAGKHEDFCLGGPSKPGCKHCDTVCDEDSADPKAPCAKPKSFSWTEWIPGCNAKQFTKTKLMKKTVTKTIPSFKWVVEDLCAECENRCAQFEVPADAPVPPPPATTAKIVRGLVAPVAY